MKTESDPPQWLALARARWPQKPSSETLDPKWTPYWIGKFLVYLKRRNQGELPDRAPSEGIGQSFVRFISANWDLEAFQVEQELQAGRGIRSRILIGDCRRGFYGYRDMI